MAALGGSGPLQAFDLGAGGWSTQPMPAISGVQVLLAIIVAVALWYIRRWWILERGRGQTRRPRPLDHAIGFAANFFDTLGMGSFAPTTAIFKLQWRMPAPHAGIGAHPFSAV